MKHAAILLLFLVCSVEMIIGQSFFPLLTDQKPYEVLIGGAGSGKSEFCGRKIFYRCMTEGGHNAWILRKVNRTLKDSVIPLMQSILDQNGIQYTYNKTDQYIDFTAPNGRPNRLNFSGLDNREKIKSLKGATLFWLEEVTEFTFHDFIQIDLRLREPTGHYQQIMMSLNPDEAQAPWIKEVFCDKLEAYREYWEASTVHFSTWADNPIAEVREKYAVKLARIKDPVYRKIYVEGLWAAAKGIIFQWDVVPLPTNNLSWYDSIFYGGDFGYSVDPAAFVRIYRKANEFWLEKLIYETGLTNIQLGHKIKRLPNINTRHPQYWDSAEPKSIQELKDMGLNAKPAEKGKDSVIAGIDFLKQQTIHIVQGSDEIVTESRRYRYAEDKNGNSLPEPIDDFNHAIDAVRYGIYTHCHKKSTLALANLGNRY